MLIGTIFVMARLAQSSEYTILRTSGLGPWRALRTLLLLGAAFVVLTFAVGDYVAPVTDRAAQLLKARYQGPLALIGNTGAWLKERQGDSSFAVNVVSMGRNGILKDPRILEFDGQGFLVSQISAPGATVDRGHWTLINAERQLYETRGPGAPRILRTTVPVLEWPTSLSNEMVSVAARSRKWVAQQRPAKRLATMCPAASTVGAVSSRTWDSSVAMPSSSRSKACRSAGHQGSCSFVSSSASTDSSSTLSATLASLVGLLRSSVSSL